MSKTTKEELFRQSREAVKDIIAERFTNPLGARVKAWKEFPEDKANVPFNGKLSLEIQLTGDVNELADYYISNEEKLTDDEKDYLKGRIGTALYLNELQEEQEKKPNVKAFGVKQGSKDDDISLTGYANKYQFQTSKNGCWSCAYAMLLESRGVSLNQQVIRAFRPAMKKEEVKDLSSEEVVSGLVKNDTFNPFELADLTSKVLPGSAIRQVVLPQYDKENKDQKKAVKKALQNYIAEAFKEHHSPVALNCGGHFVTIVGMKGDELKVLNSSNGNQNKEETRSLDSIITGRDRLSICWLQDLKLTKEGALKESLKGFPDIKYDKGKLAGEGAPNEALNKDGKTFVKASNDKVKIFDYLYVPKQVPEAFYSLDAVSKEQENRPARQAILDGIAAAHSQMVDIIQGADTIAANNMTGKDGSGLKEYEKMTPEMTEQAFATQEEVFRLALAELLTNQTLLVACDQPNETAKDEDLMRLLKDKNTAKKLAESKEFDDFCKEIKTGTLLALCEESPEQRNKAVADLHRDFLKSIKEKKKADPVKNQTGKEKKITAEKKNNKKTKIVNNLKVEKAAYVK